MQRPVLLFVCSCLAIAQLSAQCTHGFAVGDNDPFPLFVNDSLHPWKTFPLTVLEEQPHFPGGQAGWMEYTNSALKQAIVDEHEQTTTTVKADVIIEKDGHTYVKHVSRSSGPYAQVLMQAVEQMPCWSPGIKDGKPITVWWELYLHICME